METYFRMMFVVKFIVPLFIVAAAVLFIGLLLIKGELKAKIMRRMGYKYEDGLGTRRVAYEFQPHWVKNNIRINCREIENENLFKVRPYVKNKERRYVK